MTGNQPHPGTGLTLMGTHSEPISIPEVCRALGCPVVLEADPLDFETAKTALREALDCPGVSVVILKSPCVQLFRALPAVSVDAQACTGCGACVRKTGCPALSMGAPVAVDGPDGQRGARCAPGPRSTPRCATAAICARTSAPSGRSRRRARAWGLSSATC